MIACKPSVRFSILRPEIWSILGRVYEAFRQFGQGCIITCGTDGHGPDDPHTHGFAIDLRTRHIPSVAMKHALCDALCKSLGSDYTVILESEGQPNEHIHIQLRKDLWRAMK